MIRDYAKYKASEYEATKHKRSLWVILALLLMVIAALFITRPWVADKVAGEPEKTVLAQTQPQKPTMSTIVANEPRFDFYDILTETNGEALSSLVTAGTNAQNEPQKTPEVMVVQATPADTPSAKTVSEKALVAKKSSDTATTSPVASDLQAIPYVVSLGEYKSYKLAQKQRAGMLLEGIDVKLTQLRTGDKTAYRLEVGPFHNWREAHAVQLTLEQQHQLRGQIVS